MREKGKALQEKGVKRCKCCIKGVNFGIPWLMAALGAHGSLVFFEERKQTIPPQSGHRLYLTLTV
jgi:hypothetical protein